MEDELRIACAQMTGVSDKDTNLARAEALVERAAGGGANLVVLPEHWNVMGDQQHLAETAEHLDGVSTNCLREWARRFGVAIVGGSIVEQHPAHERVFNTCVAVARDGSIAAVYRKIHLFDVSVGDVEHRESDLVQPGDEIVNTALPDWNVGLTICYDLRFPELFRALTLAGAEVITVPANFTLYTGKDHWELLLRARAVENQLYVAAAAQFVSPKYGSASYGRSMICDPWGTVLAQAPDEEAVILATVTRSRLRDIRTSLPSLANRAPATYAASAGDARTLRTT